jgi:hypothetical protein
MPCHALPCLTCSALPRTTMPAQDGQPGHAAAAGLPPVLDVLYTRLLHACADDTWQVQLFARLSARAKCAVIVRPLISTVFYAALCVSILRLVLLTVLADVSCTEA